MAEPTRTHPVQAPAEVREKAPRFTSVVAALPPATPFVAPEVLERKAGRPLRLRLGANESSFGPSPKALEAMRIAARDVGLYGDPENYELRDTLAAQHRVDVNDIVVGNGIDGLTSILVRAFVEPGVDVVTTRGTYPTFNYHVHGHGGTIHTVSYRNDRIDCDALSDTAQRCDARLVYLANPDNPSGTWLDAGDVIQLAATLPPTCLLVLDEAYAEFADPGSLISIDSANPRIVHLRTFSKAHGMAGARIGYLIAHQDITTALNKIRNQFEVSRISQVGALTSLHDTGHIKSVIDEVAAGRADYEQLAADWDLPTIPSRTNFVCIDVGSAERSVKLVRQLEERGVFIRRPGAPPLNRCIRVTVGTSDERASFADIFRATLQTIH